MGDDGPEKRGRGIQRIAAFLLIFLAGGLIGSYNLQPMRFIAGALDQTGAVWSQLTRDRWDILYPNKWPGEGLVAYDPAKSSPGLTLVQGLLPDGTEVRLYAPDGTILHTWPVDFFAIWPDYRTEFPATEIPQTKWNYYVQGLYAFPDGSVLVNVSDKGIARLDKCGRPIWRIANFAHHSITRATDGTFLVPSHILLSEVSEDLFPPGLSREDLIAGRGGVQIDFENTVERVSEDGRVLSRISVLRAIHEAGLEAALYDASVHDMTVPTHLNDAEEVTPALAAKIPGVEAGDILVSLRNMSMIAILDRDTGKLLWHKRGPWVHQHDPDITADGRIEIFNNRSPRAQQGVTGSQIVSYDPATDRTEVLFPVSEADNFGSQINGAHQLLPNGNRLIAESTAGRVFEVTPKGEIVWDLVIPFDAKDAALATDAERVPLDYFQVTDWSCP